MHKQANVIRIAKGYPKKRRRIRRRKEEEEEEEEEGNKNARGSPRQRLRLL